MRVVLIGLAGIAASFAIFGLSQLADGFIGAVAYMLALLVAPVSIGAAIAMAIDRRLDQPVGQIGRASRKAGRTSESHRCGGCGSAMTAVDFASMDFAWVCGACDLVPARR